MQESNYAVMKQIFDQCDWNSDEMKRFFQWRAIKEENDSGRMRYHMLDNEQIKVFHFKL